MDDSKIIELYFARDKSALSETKDKYGRYLFTIAGNILGSREDAEECEADTYIEAWKSIPPERPLNLKAFLGKITRNISLKRLRRETAEKRGGTVAFLPFEELNECITAGKTVDDAMDAIALAEIINAFLETLPSDERCVFLCRYWYFDSIKDISLHFGFTESKVKVMLKRTRDALRVHLEKEGLFV